MQHLNHDETTDLYSVDFDGRRFESASKALMAACFNEGCLIELRDEVATMLNFAFDRTQAERQEMMRNYLAATFINFLLEVCKADQEETDETLSMVSFDEVIEKVLRD